jgi:3-dehydroquinate synthase
MHYPIKVKEIDVSDLYTGTSVFSSITDYLQKHFHHSNQIYILVDENTKIHCLPGLQSFVPKLQSAEIIEVKSGDIWKSIDSALHVWSKLSEKNADRDSILINLGGGTISDLGGFVAATYKRGIIHMNVPTTLLAMTDAAIGGKTGINLNNIKNQIGVFALPRAIFIYSGFLRTLDKHHLLNGIAEVLKYGLILDQGLWNKMKKMDFQRLVNEPFRDALWDDLIKKTVKTKSDIAEKDFRDLKERKYLNFGHTFGHAFETFSMKDNQDGLSHGHAVALGMICESYLSTLKTTLAQHDLNEIISVLTSNYPLFPISRDSYDKIIDIIKKDKKSIRGEIAFTLLKSPGNAMINQFCTEKMMEDSLDFYCGLTNR